MLPAVGKETVIPQLPGEVPRGGYVYLAQAVK